MDRPTRMAGFASRGAPAVAWAIFLTLPLPCRAADVPGEAPLIPPTPLRPVRVLVASDVARVRLRVDGDMTVTDANGVVRDTLDARDWMSVSVDHGGRLRLGPHGHFASGVTVQPRGADVVSMAVRRKGAWSPHHPYPGTLRLMVSEKGRLDVLNLVDVEQYVGCVVANEVWPTFETEAYRGQAIAARSYVLYQMKRRNGARFDVAATQGAQVYRGVRTDTPGRRGVEAARDTHGLVCTWHDGKQDRLFSTYYSAACGGLSQSASIFGDRDDIAPLAGNVPCDYCRIAPGDTYRWGPVRLTKSEIQAQLLSTYPELSSLGAIKKITVSKRTGAGRPVRLRITGSRGKPHEILAERFRLAVGAGALRSTDFSIRGTDRHIVFENGRGFGHGLGLCQWGMDGQARSGRRAGEILRFYYPGSKLTRVY